MQLQGLLSETGRWLALGGTGYSSGSFQWDGKHQSAAENGPLGHLQPGFGTR